MQASSSGSAVLYSVKRAVKKLLGKDAIQNLPLTWRKRAEVSWLARQFPVDTLMPAAHPLEQRIELLAQETNRKGPQPLWEGYAGNNTMGGVTRMPEGVRTISLMGRFYAALVRAWQPALIVEFGTAFGVSGMYFLAGIEDAGKGHLYTFEPNEVWRKLALPCLARISGRFTSVAGTFEDKVDAVLPRGMGIDLAFIDAIHTRAFVMPQLELVLAHCSDHALIILDDINFSDDMRECWQDVAADPRFVSAVEVGKRVGIVEFRRSASADVQH